MSTDRVEIVCSEQWVPKQLLAYFLATGGAKWESTYKPYIVGGKYNKTLALYRKDGNPVTRQEVKILMDIARSQYHDHVL